MFKYTPKSDAELAQAKLIPVGIYNFEVISSTYHMSEKGNESIKLYIKLWDNEEKERFIYDYLSDNFAHFKLKHFCMTTGLKGKYDSGAFNENDCAGKTGKLRIGVYKDKKDNSDKNNIIDYIVDNMNESSIEKNHKFVMKSHDKDAGLNDPIPF